MCVWLESRWVLGWEQEGLGTLMIPIVYAHLFARTSLLLNSLLGILTSLFWSSGDRRNAWKKLLTPSVI